MSHCRSNATGLGQRESERKLLGKTIDHSLDFVFLHVNIGSSSSSSSPSSLPLSPFLFVSSHFFFAILQRQTLVNHAGLTLNRYTFPFFFFSLSSSSSPPTLVKKKIDICRSQPMTVDIHISFFPSLLFSSLLFPLFSRSFSSLL